VWGYLHSTHTYWRKVIPLYLVWGGVIRGPEGPTVPAQHIVSPDGLLTVALYHCISDHPTRRQSPRSGPPRRRINSPLVIAYDILAVIGQPVPRR